MSLEKSHVCHWFELWTTLKKKNFPRFPCFVFISVGLGFYWEYFDKCASYQVFVKLVIHDQINNLIDYHMTNL